MLTRVKLTNYNDLQKCVFCPIAQTFLLVGPFFQHRPILLSVTMASTYSAVASLKILAIENVPLVTVQLRIVD